MQAAPLARWRWAGCGSPPPPPLRGPSAVPLAALLPLALLLLIGLPQGRPAQTPPRAQLLSPRRPPLLLPPPPAPASLEAALEAEALEAEALAEEALAAEAEALAEDGAPEAAADRATASAGGTAAGAAKRQQHQFDDYGHMRFGKRAQEGAAAQRTLFRRRPPAALLQRVRKFDDYGHMRFGRSEQ